MNEYEITTLALIVKPKNEPIFSEQATIVEMSDDAAGPYITIRQVNDHSQNGEIKFNPDEWPRINEAIVLMLEVCEQQQLQIK